MDKISYLSVENALSCIMHCLFLTAKKKMSYLICKAEFGNIAAKYWKISKSYFSRHICGKCGFSVFCPELQVKYKLKCVPLLCKYGKLPFNPPVVVYRCFGRQYQVSSPNKFCIRIQFNNCIKLTVNIFLLSK